MNQLLMLLATLVLGAIIGTGVYPIMSKSQDTGRVALVNQEISSIKTAALLWLTKDSDGTFTSASVTNLTSYVPGFTVTGGKFVSKANTGITYDVAVKTGDSSQFTITVAGLTVITGAETSVKTTQTSIASNITDTSATDGILALDFRG